jgi:hypothetical protein
LESQMEKTNQTKKKNQWVLRRLRWNSSDYLNDIVLLHLCSFLFSDAFEDSDCRFCFVDTLWLIRREHEAKGEQKWRKKWKLEERKKKQEKKKKKKTIKTNEPRGMPNSLLRISWLRSKNVFQSILASTNFWKYSS